MDPGLARKKIGKSSQNSSILILIFCGSIPCVFCMLLKVVSHYDLIVLSMSVGGFHKSLDKGWVGEASTIQFFYLNFNQIPLRYIQTALPLRNWFLSKQSLSYHVIMFSVNIRWTNLESI